MPMSGRFAGEVPGVELIDGGLEVVEVKDDPSYHQPVGVDLGNLQRFNVERVGLRVALLEPHMAEAEPIASQGERRVSDVRAQSCDRTNVIDRCSTIVALAAESLPPVFEADVVGVQGADFIEAPVGKEGERLVIYPSRGILQGLSRMCLLLEPGMRGIEFGDRGVHVFEVEEDLQGDPTLFVDAIYLEKFILRRPGARIGSAHHHLSESQALASHGDIVPGEAHAARPQNAPNLACPVFRWDDRAGSVCEANDLPAALAEDLG